MKILVFIRLEQLRSLLRNSNNSLKRRLIAFLLLFLLCIISISTRKPLIYLAIPCILIFLLHTFRNDFDLLKKMGLSVYKIVLTEYLILSLPYLIAGIVFHHSLGVIFLIIYILILPTTHPKRLVHIKQFFN